MSIGLKEHRRTLLFVATLVAGMIANPALAADPPQGPYQKTCTNAGLVGDLLYATCKTDAGGMVESALPRSNGCVGNQIYNYNGTLVCLQPQGSAFGNDQIPVYCTSYSVNTTTAISSALCPTLSKGSIVSQATPSGVYTNCDGQLTISSKCPP